MCPVLESSFDKVKLVTSSMLIKLLNQPFSMLLVVNILFPFQKSSLTSCVVKSAEIHSHVIPCLFVQIIFKTFIFLFFLLQVHVISTELSCPLFIDWRVYILLNLQLLSSYDASSFRPSLQSSFLNPAIHHGQYNVPIIFWLLKLCHINAQCIKVLTNLSHLSGFVEK